MNPSLFDNNEEPIKLMRIGAYELVKWEKKELKGRWLGVGVKELEEEMQSKVNELVKKKRGITSERQSVLKEILDIINLERETSKEKKKYPPLTGRALAIKLSHVLTEDLYFMKSEAMDYKKRGKGAFGQAIFGMVKVKK